MVMLHSTSINTHYAEYKKTKTKDEQEHEENLWPGVLDLQVSPPSASGGGKLTFNSQSCDHCSTVH